MVPGRAQKVCDTCGMHWQLLGSVVCVCVCDCVCNVSVTVCYRYATSIVLLVPLCYVCRATGPLVQRLTPPRS